MLVYQSTLRETIAKCLGLIDFAVIVHRASAAVNPARLVCRLDFLILQISTPGAFPVHVHKPQLTSFPNRNVRIQGQQAVRRHRRSQTIFVTSGLNVSWLLLVVA